jgi:hypothetical protein
VLLVGRRLPEVLQSDDVSEQMTWVEKLHPNQPAWEDQTKWDQGGEVTLLNVQTDERAEVVVTLDICVARAACEDQRSVDEAQ